MADREAAALRLAKDWSAVALLKGHRTLISDGERVVVNASGGPGLAKGGTGDVLTGLIAGLWAQMLASSRVEGKTAFLAAALGAHLHGAAGDLAEKRLTAQAMTAQDVIGSLPEAFAQL
jgi:NAD(P)H-hydrate epimerase